MAIPISIASNDLYVAISPDGVEIEIPKELFGVLHDFMEGHKQTGSAIIQFKNGGIAGLETMIKRTYK